MTAQKQEIWWKQPLCTIRRLSSQTITSCGFGDIRYRVWCVAEIFSELPKQNGFGRQAFGAASHIRKRGHYLLYFTIVGDISLQLNPKEMLNSAPQNPRDVTPSARLAAWHKAERLRKLEDAAFLGRTMAESDGGKERRVWGLGPGHILRNGWRHLYCSRRVEKTSPVSVTTEWTRLQMTPCHGDISPETLRDLRGSPCFKLSWNKRECILGKECTWADEAEAAILRPESVKNVPTEGLQRLDKMKAGCWFASLTDRSGQVHQTLVGLSVRPTSLKLVWNSKKKKDV